MLIRIAHSIVDMIKARFDNFKIFRSAENLTVNTTASIIDTFFKNVLII